MNTATESLNPAASGVLAQPVAPTAPASHAHPTKSARADSPRNRLALKLALGAAILAVAVWLGRVAVHTYRYEETDNAYVVGHLRQISPQISGQVKEVRVHDNQNVKAGDVLIVLDSLEFEIARQKAEANVAQAKAQESVIVASGSQADAKLAEADARVAQAEAQVVQARAQLDLSRLTLSRNDQLLKDSGAVTQADVDNSRSAFSAAQAAYDAAQANFTAARAGVGSAEAAQKSVLAQAAAASATVAVADAAVRDADRQFAYTTLAAQSDGRIGNKNVEPGNRVQAGQTLLALAEPDVWIVANFKETQLARMQVGQEVEITVDAIPGQTLRGHIDSLAPASGAQFALLPPDNATGNFNKVVQRIPVKILLEADSPRTLGDRLRLGYSAIVTVRVR